MLSNLMASFIINCNDKIMTNATILLTLQIHPTLFLYEEELSETKMMIDSDLLQGKLPIKKQDAEMDLEAIHFGLKQPNICLTHDDITKVKKLLFDT